MRRPAATLLLALAIALPTPARAWNKPGHMLTGALAYYQLRERDPAAIPAIIALLQHHRAWPMWMDSLARDPTAGPQDRDLFVFMYAARFPDDFKGMPDYDKPRYDPQHYVDFPFKPAGQPSSVHTQPPEPVNVLEALPEHLRVLRDPHATPEAKAFALSFVFHLVGDVHQPLHAAQLFTTDYPTGDAGGNLVWVTVPGNARPWRLHGLWDGMVINSYSFGRIDAAARLLLSEPAMRRAAFPQLADHDPRHWARNESYVAAVRRAYLNGTLQGGTTEPTAKPVPAGYMSDARATADGRIVLAGYRLSDLLGARF
jgi:S1/P1 Nuclease